MEVQLWLIELNWHQLHIAYQSQTQTSTPGTDLGKINKVCCTEESWDLRVGAKKTTGAAA